MVDGAHLGMTIYRVRCPASAPLAPRLISLSRYTLVSLLATRPRLAHVAPTIVSWKNAS